MAVDYTPWVANVTQFKADQMNAPLTELKESAQDEIDLKVTGPAAATDNAIARYDSTTGKLVQNSVATISDAGTVNIPIDQTYSINGIPHTHDGSGGAAGNQLISGGGVVWVSGYTYRVQAATYAIEGVLYETAEGEVTLAAADATLNRFDIIVVTATQTIDKITGTAATNPQLPAINPAAYIGLALIYVPAASAAADITVKNIYLEGAEWTFTTAGLTIVADSTNDARTGTKSIEGTAVVALDDIMLETTPAFDLSQYDLLIFYIKLKAEWAATKSIKIAWMKDGAIIGNIITFAPDTYGFTRTITTVFQQIVIPISHFGISAGATVDMLGMIFYGSGDAVGFFMDDITLQAGIGNVDTAHQSLNPRGTWVSTANYSLNDVVTLSGVTYYCLAGNVNRTPGTYTNFWSVLVPADASIDGGVGISFEETIKPAATGAYSMMIPYGMVVPANASTSLFYNKTNPTAQVVVSIKDDGTEIATLTVATDGTPTWATASGTAKTIAADSRISFVFPAQDATWAGVVITLKGVRS